MATAEEVKKLAALARIEVKDSELAQFTREFDAILDYVGQLNELNLPAENSAKPALSNVMREDKVTNESRQYTEKLAEQFPDREGDALAVKQILQHD